MITYIFGASKIDDYSYLEKIDFNNSYIICADGGIEHIKRLNLIPDVIIGDFDSSVDAGEYKNKIVFPKEKDDTDLGLAINYAAENNLIECVAIGCLGNRLDHTFANICLLCDAYKKGVTLKLIDEKTSVFLVDKSYKLKNDGYKYVSVFPFGDFANGVILKGFKYPLNNYSLFMHYPLGVSNQLVDEFGIIEVNDGILIVMTVKE